MSRSPVADARLPLTKARNRVTIAIATSAAASIVGVVFWVWLLRRPPLRVSPETTAITAPLDAEGYPDYAAALLAQLADGVTPETNAAIPLLRAVWPYGEGYNGEAGDGALVWRAIGGEGEPPKTAEFTPLDTPERRVAAARLLQDRWRNLDLPPEGVGPDLSKLDYSPWEMINEQFLAADPEVAARDGRVEMLLSWFEGIDRPWTRTDAPFVAEWLDENEEAIDRMVAGLDRSAFFAPSAPLLRDPPAPLIEGLPMDELMGARSAARVLMTRCYLRLDEGDPAGAMGDAVAIVRLSRHLMTGPYCVNQLIAYAVIGIGARALESVAASADVSAETLRSAIDELDRLPEINGFRRTSEIGERWTALDDTIGKLWRGRFEELYGDPDDEVAAEFLETIKSSPEERLKRRLRRWSFDGNAVLEALNAAFDQLSAAATLPMGEAADAIEAFVRDANAALEDSERSLWTFRGRTEAAVALGVVESCGTMLAFIRAEQRVQTRLTLTRTALRLAVAKAEGGNYPDRLDAVCDAAPIDSYLGLPLRYRRTEEGFLLWSVGPNGVDDGGSHASYGLAALFEGLPVDVEWPTDSDKRVGKNAEAQELLDRIPEGADDESLRVPIPVTEAWPWEELAEMAAQ